MKSSYSFSAIRNSSRFLSLEMSFLFSEIRDIRLNDSVDRTLHLMRERSTANAYSCTLETN